MSPPMTKLTRGHYACDSSVRKCWPFNGVSRLVKVIGVALNPAGIVPLRKRRSGFLWALCLVEERD